MRSRIPGALICAPLLCGAVHAQTANTVDTVSNDQFATAKSVGQEVQLALQRANDTGLSGLRVTKADLKLETGLEVSGGFEINFIIFTIQHKSKKSETQTTELEFSLPNRTRGAKVTTTLSDPLAQAVAAAAATASQINVLPLTKATITIDFAVSKDNSGKISCTVLGTKIGGGVDLTKASKNTLAVTFSK